MTDMYNTNLDKNHANFTPLSPLSFLQRSAEVYPNRKSIVHGSKSYTWSDTFKRSKQLASPADVIRKTTGLPRDFVFRCTAVAETVPV